jgi:Mg/Co/Ni transporter MgtE
MLVDPSPDCSELEQEITVLRRALSESNARNQRLLLIINKHYGISTSRPGEELLIDPEDGSVSGTGMAAPIVTNDASFIASLWDRGSWLAMLLLFQSFSSFILAHHEGLLTRHPSIIFYLTALVGAGGNAGNQAAVRIIRALALGLVNDKNRNIFLQREFCMAVALSFVLGFVLILRTFLSSVTYLETLVVLLSIFVIVFLSVNLGALLPLLLQRLGFDPAHAGTTIQVVMDITGVLITCRVAQWLF